MNSIASIARRHPLAAFVGLTFALSWGIWISLIVSSTGITTPAGAVLNALAIAGPSIGAIVVAGMLGRTRLRDLVAGLSPARSSTRWVITALALPLVMVAIAIVIAVALLGAAAPTFSIALVGIIAVEFVRILFVGGPLGEEIGWRGFALPRLQATRTKLAEATSREVPPATADNELLEQGKVA